MESIRAKFLALKPAMDERLTRLWAGAEAEALGEGGISVVEEATGMSRTTIRVGRDELREGVSADDVVSVRRAGGGRPSIETTSPGIIVALEGLVDPVTRGDPESPLRWSSKSTRKLASELGAQGYKVRISKTNRGFGSVASERPAWGQMTGWIDATRSVSSVTTLGSRSGRGRSWALIPPAWRGGDR